jgi:hypothetical protein
VILQKPYIVDFWAKIAHFRGIGAFFTGLQARYNKML